MLVHYNRLFNLAVPVRRSLGLIKKAKPGYDFDPLSKFLKGSCLNDTTVPGRGGDRLDAFLL